MQIRSPLGPGTTASKSNPSHTCRKPLRIRLEAPCLSCIAVYQVGANHSGERQERINTINLSAFTRQDLRSAAPLLDSMVNLDKKPGFVRNDA